MASIKTLWNRLTKRFKLSVVVLLALLLGALAYVWVPKPDLGINGSFYQGYSHALYDRDGSLLRLTLADDQRYRLYTPLEQISSELIDATILYEDQDYYKHSGVDYPALLRAFWQTYVRSERRIGASTITMQVARLRWQIPSNTISGKLEQIFRALQISRHYSKDDVLEAYLNLTPYGGNIEGIGAASLIYFGKKPTELNLIEALTLALVPQNPNKRRPSNPAAVEAIQLARQTLAERWQQAYPTRSQGLHLLDLPLSVRSPNDLPFLAPHFTSYVLGSDASLGDTRHLATTLDLEIQTALEARVSQYIDARRSWGFENASAMIVDTRSMHILAMLGSVDFFDKKIQGQVNGTQALRSPGSTLKPFVYGLAIDAGIIHPNTMLNDLPTRYAAFTPENFGKGFAGPLSATDALVKSRNVPAVQLQASLNQLNAERDELITLYELLEKTDIPKLKNEAFYGLALTLGGSEITMHKLLELYALLSNKGEHKELVSIHWGSAEQSAITNGETKPSTQLLSPEAAFLIKAMLSENAQLHKPKLSALGASSSKPKIAWKTGTSWAYRDAWAIGLVGDYAVAVWIGNFSGAGNNAFVGRSAAGPLLFDIANYLDDLQPNQKTDVQLQDLNLKQLTFCKSTGDLYEAGCPEATQGFFIPGVSPIKPSNIYRALYIDKLSGKQRCDRDLEKAEKRYYAFWPSEVMALYAKAGIYFEQPPDKHESCDWQSSNQITQELTVILPQANTRYFAKADNKGRATVALKANASSGATYLYWFANNEFITEINLKETTLDSSFIWHAEPGLYDVLVSDDLGNSALVAISVATVN